MWLDGNLLGIHQRPLKFVSALRKLRRGGRLGRFVSVHTHRDGVHIAADGGRVCRPLIVCHRGVPQLTPAHVEKVGQDASLPPGLFCAAAQLIVLQCPSL